MRSLKAPPLRVGAEDSSSRCGNLRKGEEVVVTEAKLNSGGAIRLRCERGWFSLKNNKGAELVENLGRGVVPTPLPPKAARPEVAEEPEPAEESEPAPAPAPSPVSRAMLPSGCLPAVIVQKSEQFSVRDRPQRP